MDSASGEGIFQVAVDENGVLLMAFRLYDAAGRLVAESEGLDHYPDGLTIRCSGGELLLDIPADSGDHIQYRLYNSSGCLLTRSDGARTLIYPLLCMEGVGRNWARPSADADPAPSIGASPSPGGIFRGGAADAIR